MTYFTFETSRCKTRPCAPTPSCCGHRHPVERKAPPKPVCCHLPNRMWKRVQTCCLSPVATSGEGGERKMTTRGPRPSLPPALKTSRPLLAFLKVTLKENLFVFFIYILYFCTYCDEVSHFYRDLRLTKRGALKCVFFSVPKANKKKFP